MIAPALHPLPTTHRTGPLVLPGPTIFDGLLELVDRLREAAA